LHAFPFVSNAVINQSGKVSESDYTLAASTKLYSGLNYVLLRKPFLDAAKDKRTSNTLSKVFVCFGGADPNNLAGKAVEASFLVPSVEEIHVVVSKNFKAEDLQKLQEKSKKSIVIHSQLSAEEMCLLMRKCDVAIAPSSSISFELCSVGIALISGYFVDNQKDIFDYGKEKGLFISAEDFRELSALQLSELFPSVEQSEQLLLKQKEYFNGQSSTNFKVLFQELFSNK
jgi:UDP-2,4-diacetamido-2,4,6-trideoxy-beta-L-altropyranose hydrolase